MALARWIVCSLALAIGLTAPAAAQVVDLSVSTITFGVAQCFWSAGTPSPEGNVTGKPCDRYFETDASVEWVKGAGTGTDTSGWASASTLPTPGADGTFLRSNGSVWATSTLAMPNAISAGQLIYGSSSNVLSALAAGASGTLLAGGTTPAFTATPSVTTLTGTTSLVTPTITNGSNLTLSPTGDLILNPTGNDVLPTTGYDINLGSLTSKYLTAHIAELWVQTLVAQGVMATIGGRVVVAPTTVLTSDLTAIATSVTVKHNQMASGDRIMMEAGGAVEFMAVTSGSSGSGPYTYSVTRNLDGSGANAWSAGDALMNTGAAGDGFLDIYSVQGAVPGSTAGPTIVGNVRYGTTYNEFGPMFGLGNLNGMYGYSTDVYGAAFGNDAISWLKIDSTNGIRMGFGTTTNFSVDTSGNAYFAGELEADSGLIGEWAIEEGGLTASGAGLYSDHIVTGALSVDGTSNAAYKAFASGTVNDFTLGLWAYATTCNVDRGVMLIGKVGDGYGFSLVGSNWVGHYSGIALIGSSACALNTWTHLALRRSSGTSQLFVNGVATGATVASTPLAPNGYWTIGARRNTANTGFEAFFAGRVAHAFQAYSVLTNAQIAAIATGGPGGIGLAAHLVATGNYAGQSPLFQYYPLFGGTASYDMWNLAPVAPLSVLGNVVAGPSVAMEIARTEVGSGAFTAGLVSAPTSGDVFLYGGTYFGNRAAAPFRVTNTGALTATSGTIGNWSMSTVGIYYDGAGASTSAGMVPTDWPFYAGSLAVNRATAPFRVSPAGALFASNATISGAITATSGSFTGAIVATSISLPTGSVTSAHIAANTIVAADIFAGTITATELAADSVTSAKILSGTIVASDIATGTITADRMNVSSIDAITANLGTITAGSISGVTVSGSSVYGGAGNEILLNSSGLHFSGSGGNAVIDMNGFDISYAGGGLYLDGSVSVNGDLVGPVAGSGATITYDRISAGTVLEFVNMAINTGTGVVWENACGCLKKVSSSLRYKENIRGFTLDSPYAILDSPLIRFNYKGGDPNVVGLSAEDLFKISPDLVNLDSLGQPDSVRQDAVTAHLIEALREVRRELVDIRGQVKQLSNRP